MDEFPSIPANLAALERGGSATQAARSQTCRGLLDRLVQAEINRFWLTEIVVRYCK